MFDSMSQRLFWQHTHSYVERCFSNQITLNHSPEHWKVHIMFYVRKLWSYRVILLERLPCLWIMSEFVWLFWEKFEMFKLEKLSAEQIDILVKNRIFDWNLERQIDFQPRHKFICPHTFFRFQWRIRKSVVDTENRKHFWSIYILDFHMTNDSIVGCLKLFFINHRLLSKIQPKYPLKKEAEWVFQKWNMIVIFSVSFGFNGFRGWI